MKLANLSIVQEDTESLAYYWVIFLVPQNADHPFIERTTAETNTIGIFLGDHYTAQICYLTRNLAIIPWGNAFMANISCKEEKIGTITNETES